VKDALSRATPDDGIIINYVANGPGIWYDARFDCTDLWQGHFSSAQISNASLAQAENSANSIPRLNSRMCSVPS